MNTTIQKLSPLTEASFYVLSAVQKPIHGYGIIKAIEEVTEGRLTLAAGTLYGVLQNLEKYNCIERVNKRSKHRKKEYQITSEGQELLQHEILRLQSMLEHVKLMEVT